MMIEIKPRPTYKPKTFCIDPGHTNLYNDNGQMKWHLTLVWGGAKVTEVYRIKAEGKASQMKQHWLNVWDKGDYQGFNREHWVWYQKWTAFGTANWGKHVPMSLIYRNDGSPESDVVDMPSLKVQLQLKLIELRQLERDIDALIDQL